jgi:hypothetical protein
MKAWLIFLAVSVMYVHLFNATARQYLETGHTRSVGDLWRQVVPSGKVTIEF